MACCVYSLESPQVHVKIRKYSLFVFLSYRKNFLGTQKRVRISNKRAIGVRAIWLDSRLNNARPLHRIRIGQFDRPTVNTAYIIYGQIQPVHRIRIGKFDRPTVNKQIQYDFLRGGMGLEEGVDLIKLPFFTKRQT